jgi:hypothetical protein
VYSLLSFPERMMSRLLRLLLVPLVLAACSEPAAPVADGALTATVEAPTLRLTNRGGQTVYWIVFEAGTAARTFWGPCVDPDRCPHLGPGESQSISYERITGYSPGATDAIVYWWTRVRGGDGDAAGPIRMLPLRL